MKSLRPHWGRVVAAELSVVIWFGILLAVWIGFWQWRPGEARHMVPGDCGVFKLWGAAAILGLAALSALASFGWLSTRYEIGARNLECRSGLLWRSTTTVPLLDIRRVEASSGPLLRLFGLADVIVYTSMPDRVLPITLGGLRNADDVRLWLLERRDALQEAVAAGDAPLPRERADLATERLVRAVDRLERRLEARG